MSVVLADTQAVVWALYDPARLSPAAAAALKGAMTAGRLFVSAITLVEVNFLVPKAEVPEMPDRIVAATAVTHRLPLVSSDLDIQGSASLKAQVSVIW
jgi:PIN domain nuclease of toxin-antitoxin system